MKQRYGLDCIDHLSDILTERSVDPSQIEKVNRRKEEISDSSTSLQLLRTMERTQEELDRLVGQLRDHVRKSG